MKPEARECTCSMDATIRKIDTLTPEWRTVRCVHFDGRRVVWIEALPESQNPSGFGHYCVTGPLAEATGDWNQDGKEHDQIEDQALWFYKDQFAKAERAFARREHELLGVSQ